MYFLVDNMLGSLAKWMRIIGCDTEYFPEIDDGELLAIAKREGRIIVTRDTRLVHRRQARSRSFLVRANSLRGQFREVTLYFSLDIRSHLFIRCLGCNACLKEVSRQSVKECVPPYVYETQKNFHQCPGCGKIYWPGTHREKMIRALEEMSGNK